MDREELFIGFSVLVFGNGKMGDMLFPRSNEPSASLLAFGDCREGQILRFLQRGI